MQIFAKKKGRSFTRQNPAKRDLGGFTLIELLVVIAIIGILASIVLVSVSGARDKANDARIISNMAQLRNIAELSNEAKGSYKNFGCSWSADTTSLCDDIGKQLGASPLSVGWPVFATTTSGDDYCGYAILRTKFSNATDTYCITKGKACNNIYSNVTAACVPGAVPVVGCGACR